jgi:MFS transporter, DHA1 family, inner membrane transport protein
LFAGMIVTTEKSGRILHYNWVGYLSIFVLLLSLLFGRIIFRKMDVAETDTEVERDLLQETTI